MNKSVRDWRANAVRIFCLAVLLGGAVLAACSKPAPTASKLPAYKIRGTVMAVHADDKSASIDAEAIPGFMGAMTMEYTIHDADALAKIKPHDKISGDLVADPNGSYYIDNVKIQPAP